MSIVEFEQTCKLLFSLEDKNKDSRINFTEFKILYLKVHPFSPSKNANNMQWRALFKVYDQNRDNVVSWTEAWRYFKFRERFT